MFVLSTQTEALNYTLTNLGYLLLVPQQKMQNQTLRILTLSSSLV